MKFDLADIAIIRLTPVKDKFGANLICAVWNVLAGLASIVVIFATISYGLHYGWNLVS